MPRLPDISGDRLIRVLESVGYQAVRQSGSHVRLRCADAPNRKPTTVPRHRSLAPGTLRSILRDADLSVEELIARLR